MSIKYFHLLLTVSQLTFSDLLQQRLLYFKHGILCLPYAKFAFLNEFIVSSPELFRAPYILIIKKEVFIQKSSFSSLLRLMKLIFTCSFIIQFWQWSSIGSLINSLSNLWTLPQGHSCCSVISLSCFLSILHCYLLGIIQYYFALQLSGYYVLARGFLLMVELSFPTNNLSVRYSSLLIVWVVPHQYYLSGT